MHVDKAKNKEADFYKDKDSWFAFRKTWVVAYKNNSVNREKELMFLVFKYCDTLFLSVSFN